MGSVVLILIILFLPRIMVLLSDHYKFLNILGPVFTCYLCGFLLSFVIEDTSVAVTISELCIPIAIPLVLFSANLQALKKLARPALISFILMVISVSVVSSIGFLIFKNTVPDAGKISGMMIGLYTGGTPNLMAIGLALGVPQNTIIHSNTADMIVGGIYFMLLLSVMPKLYRKILPNFDGSHHVADKELEEKLESSFRDEKMNFTFKMLLKKIPAILLSVLCVLVSLGFSWLVSGNATNIIFVMIGVSTLGITLSFIRKVRTLPGSYNAGQYLIYVFSVAMGMSFDLSSITTKTLLLLMMFFLVQFGCAAFHLVLARIFKIDSDTALITSVAGIYGPAFIPSVANAMKNKDIILSGLICGILGYAIGNYLGIGIASLLQLIT
ncbi:MAG: DUF819 family protein [Ruminococcaceae bacterium]|nr:DUF819 family protein [Oscillospiraceae bacterium]